MAEVVASRAAWPLVANGLTAARGRSDARGTIHAAGAAAGRLRSPPLFSEEESASLTGPAASLAGLYRSFDALATHGWQMIGAALDQIERGPAAAARFARANVALYIESVYDGHFSLSQIGRKLRDGYRRLGGEAGFGAALSEREVRALADAYSEAVARLHPHVGVRLGS
jgi:hypothetical protein